MSIISEMFDKLVIDNMNDIIDDISANMRRERYARDGLSEREKVWAAEQFAQTWGQAYCDCVYANAKHLNDDEYENIMDVRINDGYNSCYYIRSEKTGNKWQARSISAAAKARMFCQELFEVEQGEQAAPLAADLVLALLARTFEDYGFYVEVFTETSCSGEGEDWVMRLSWEQDTPQDEPELEAEDE